eukprot:15059-Heterococcus_DN1.PRE.6
MHYSKREGVVAFSAAQWLLCRLLSALDYLCSTSRYLLLKLVNIIQLGLHKGGNVNSIRQQTHRTGCLPCANGKTRRELHHRGLIHCYPSNRMV